MDKWIKFLKEKAKLIKMYISVYVATTHLATTFYKKMEHIYKNRAGLSLLNLVFDVTGQKTIR